MIKFIKNGIDLGKSKVSGLDSYKVKDKINSKNYPSEKWFLDKFQQDREKLKFPEILTRKKLALAWYNDQYNYPFLGFFPDIINRGMKYIIEIDGNIHDQEDIKEKDKVKTQLFSSFGYKVFRVRAYSEESYNKFLQEFSDYLETLPKRI